MLKKQSEKINKGEVKIYKPSKGEVELKVWFEDETVWLRQNEIAELFGKDRSVITKHINKIFKQKEVDEKGNVQKMHIPNSDKPVSFYNLDVVLAVGYRVNSAQAINFRHWATKILKNYLIQGYAINKKRLIEAENKFKQLKETINFLQKRLEKEKLQGQEKEFLNLLNDYANTFSILEKYDKNQLKVGQGKKTDRFLEYKKCLNLISELKKRLVSKKEASDIFGNEAGHGLESVISNLYQTFSDKELYRSIEEKASHLLYLIIKDHPFTDGNKRIASFL